MAGLMTENRRHSGFMTNFSIFMAESRLYWSWYGCGSPGVRRGPAGALECLGDTVGGLRHGLGPGNTNPGCGRVGTRYSTLPAPTHPYPTPGTTPPRNPRTRTTSAGEGAAGAVHMTVLRSTKEILGVENALYMHGVGRGTPGTVLALPPPYAPGSSARSLAPSLSYSQYISVISQLYLRFKDISVLRISQI